MRCAERERLAQDAERKAVDLARAALMGREIGRVFDGVAVNVTNAGVFIVLGDCGASGLWRGRVPALRAPMNVRLTVADAALGRLELEPVRSALANQVLLSPWRQKKEPRGRK